jgi:Transposase zinc-binding domain
VRDNLETLYGATFDGAIAVRIPKHARKELEAYLDCGLLCRGFARLRCEDCAESRLVAFSCKGRGFCPSCTGRRMSATAANLMERVLPQVGLRQWVLTFPFPWRRRLSQDGALLGKLTRIFASAVQQFYAARGPGRGPRCEDRLGDGRAEDVVGPAVEPTPARGRAGRGLVRAGRRAHLGGTRAPRDQ